MPPAARIGDLHTCPLSDGPKPHVGGPIAVGCPTVLIGGMPAARVGDMAVCVGPPDVIAKGSATVFIGGMPAARMGDNTAHGGVITVGFPQVMIGDAGAGGGGGGAGSSSLVDSFLKGVEDSLLDPNNAISFAARLALMALGLNPAIAGAVMAAYGAYQIYQTLNELGNGDVAKGADVAWEAISNGSADDVAYAAGHLATTVMGGKGQSKLADKLGRMARKSKKMKALRNSQKGKKFDSAVKKMNGKTHQGTATGKGLKAADAVGEKAIAPAGTAKDTAKNAHKNQQANSSPSSEPASDGDDQAVMFITPEGGETQSTSVKNEDFMITPSPDSGDNP